MSRRASHGLGSGSPAVSRHCPTAPSCSSTPRGPPSSAGRVSRSRLSPSPARRRRVEAGSPPSARPPRAVTGPSPSTRFWPTGGTGSFASRPAGQLSGRASAPGAPPQVLFQAVQTPASGQPPLTVDIAATAINDLGQAAFLWSRGGALRVQRAGPGAAFLVGPNSQAPGGGTFSEITDLGPSIDAAGDVLFGALRSDGRLGLYVVGPQGLAAVAEEGVATGSGETLTAIGARDPDPRPAFGLPGSIWFAARMAGGGGIFSAASGEIQAAVNSGDPIPG